jgi:hypothetical protein
MIVVDFDTLKTMPDTAAISLAARHFVEFMRLHGYTYDEASNNYDVKLACTGPYFQYVNTLYIWDKLMYAVENILAVQPVHEQIILKGIFV